MLLNSLFHSCTLSHYCLKLSPLWSCHLQICKWKKSRISPHSHEYIGSLVSCRESTLVGHLCWELSWKLFCHLTLLIAVCRSGSHGFSSTEWCGLLGFGVWLELWFWMQNYSQFIGVRCRSLLSRRNLRQEPRRWHLPWTCCGGTTWSDPTCEAKTSKICSPLAFRSTQLYISTKKNHLLNLTTRPLTKHNPMHESAWTTASNCINQHALTTGVGTWH